MNSDVEINQAAQLKSIDEIVKSLDIKIDDLFFYGPYQAKLKPSFTNTLKEHKTSKLILVTAMSPTPAGEGKTTTTIGLADALFSIGKKSAACLREPSLGPVFGMKGGATGGGYAQVAPMDKINLHFTGDFHAITSANNLLAALIDNHIHHGNELNIDINQISFKRCLDMNDRLKDAFQPNLVQTLHGTPAFIHGGPFANIAHGCNSVIATKTALKLADYIVTEAGFGADLGAEKFIDIKCRQSGIKPDIIVLVATIRALKFHGGIAVSELNQENLKALELGFNNLKRHIENCSEHFGLDVIVSINQFSSDTEKEMTWLQSAVDKLGFKAILCSHWSDGAKGAKDLANAVLGQLSKPKTFKFLYEDDLSLKDKITTIALKIYRAKEVQFSDSALNKLLSLEKNYANLPVCIAKTPYSFSSDPKECGAPENHTLMIRELRLARGAGFVVAICGDLMTMPGLPKRPASEKIQLNSKGLLEGLN